MNEQRFREITGKYAQLRLAVVGDICLDRYLEIDATKSETSIETSLDVFNVVNVRSQPGAAGTILNNLVALGIGEMTPVGFCGRDGEGFELLLSLEAMRGVCMNHFLQTAKRRTFTYCKPLVIEQGQSPRELNRLDSKNWTATPEEVRDALRRSFLAVAAGPGSVDGIILMDQVDLRDTGVLTSDLLEVVQALALRRPELLMVADSRRSLKGWPPVHLKMNERELAALTRSPLADLADAKATAAALAREKARPVFVTLAERGILGADASGHATHVPAHSVRGEIDIVGAGDAVTANLTAALAAGATVAEAMELAMAAASVVVHQLGTTGTASVAQIHDLVFPS